MFATFRTALKSRVVWALCPEIRTSTIQDVTFPASSVPASLVLTTIARRRCKGPGCPPPDTKKSPAGSTREQENGGSVIRRHRLIASRDGVVAHDHGSVTPQNPGVTLRVQGEGVFLETKSVPLLSDTLEPITRRLRSVSNLRRLSCLVTSQAPPDRLSISA